MKRRFKIDAESLPDLAGMMLAIAAINLRRQLDRPATKRTPQYNLLRSEDLMRLAPIIGILFFSISIVSGTGWADDRSQLDAERVVLAEQIEDVERVIASYDGGLIRSLAEARREALLLSQTLIESRQRAEKNGATIEIVLPAVEPNPERAKELLGEIAAVQARVEEAEREAASAGGLIKALVLSRVETEKLTLAQLQMGYLQAQYGIAFPAQRDIVVDKATNARKADPTSRAPAHQDSNDGTAALAWADPRYPDVDYTLAPFEIAHNDGNQIVGWWTIDKGKAAIDDSPRIFAVNYSLYKNDSFTMEPLLILQCREGVTSITYFIDKYLSSNHRNNSFNIRYRIDEKPAQNTRWSKLTSNKGAGVFGPKAEKFLRHLYDAEQFFIRLTEARGRIHDAQFNLAGVQDAIESVASGCGWSTLELTRDDYRAIQTLLNAGGYDAGTPDGIWGERSREAMRAFQEAAGITPTGVPDRSTMESMNFSEALEADVGGNAPPDTRAETGTAASREAPPPNDQASAVLRLGRLEGYSRQGSSLGRADSSGQGVAGSSAGDAQGSLESFEATSAQLAQACLERAGAFRPTDHFTGNFPMRVNQSSQNVTIQGRPNMREGVVPQATFDKIESGLSKCPEFMRHLASRPDIREFSLKLFTTGLGRRR